MTDDAPQKPVVEFADALKDAGKFCATIARARVAAFWRRRFIPQVDDPTATVTFILFEGRTYAVTAAHVVSAFESAAKTEGCYPESYFVPIQPGVCIGPPFIKPPTRFMERAPDVALRPIRVELPAYVRKRAFELNKDSAPTFPLAAALAAGFPTWAKDILTDPRGERLILRGVHAVAEGVRSLDADQVQFFSEIGERPLIARLSGMSGGPVFWSEGETFGLLGFVKEALDAEPTKDETLHLGPKVNFICQRASYETFGAWAEFAETEFPKQRHEIGKLLSSP